MRHFITLVAANPKTLPLSDKEIATTLNILAVETSEKTWLCINKAVDIPLPNKPERNLITTIRETLNNKKIDVFITPAENRRKKLLLADMDSTIVTGETLDDLAAFAGIKDMIAAITARAMNGELDFHTALRERVSLLKGLKKTALQHTLNDLKLNSGAERFIHTMKHHGATCVLVSGGFTFFTNAVAKKVNFDHHHGNILEIENGLLTGTVAEPILDKHAKVHFLKKYINELNLTPDNCLTIGDGANDLPMLQMAGLGIGYKPKPAVAAELDNIILHGDLANALYAQGLKDQEIFNPNQ